MEAYAQRHWGPIRQVGVSEIRHGSSGFSPRSDICERPEIVHTDILIGYS